VRPKDEEESYIGFGNSFEDLKKMEQNNNNYINTSQRIIDDNFFDNYDIVS